MPISKDINGLLYGNNYLTVYVCAMEYHEYHGYYMWDNDVPPIEFLVQLSDDKSMIVVYSLVVLASGDMFR